MNLKTFAQQSRTVLMEGVANKLLYWGFNEKGEVQEEPQKISGGYLLRDEPKDDPNVPLLWSALKNAIQQKGIEVVVEEAAYTWFNRIMAIRILAKNGYNESILENVAGMEHTPIILQKARQGHYGFLEAKEQERLKKIISDYNKDQEAFGLLLTGYCHSHNTLNRVFGKLDDYTELLLPDNMLQDGGFLHLINTTDAISTEDYQTVELIGWLYQFYISEKKDEVFASFKKNKKAEAKDIPAATQIFTPNWIVKYMVENTAGKIWLDKNPDSALKSQMKYLVVNEEKKDVSSSAERIENSSIIKDVEELTLIDPACGSGHILVEGFNLLYQMYMEEYYTPEEAVASILKNNLFGLDIDDRAAQLATFAILLKAAKVYSDVWTKDWLPQVYAMPEAQNFSQQELKDFLGAEGEDYLEELDDALRLMKQAKNLGSVMKLKLGEEAQTYIAQRFEELKTATYRDFNVEAVYQSIQTYIPVLLLLTKKYTSVVANPPYMGSGNMNANLKNYVNVNYPRSKSDLCTVFIEVLPNYTLKKGKYGFIVPPSWMFLSSYEKLRHILVDEQNIDSLLHLSRGVFGADFGSVSAVITNEMPKEDSKGTYFRLVERTFQEFYHGHLEQLFLLSKVDSGFKYKFTEYSKEKPNLVHNEDGLKTFYPNVFQNNFTKLPGSPIAYWASKKVIEAFSGNQYLSDEFESGGRCKTHNDTEFVRRIWELDKSRIFKSEWKIYNKGGGSIKWYGNLDYAIDWNKNSRAYYASHGGLSNQKFWNRSGITWSGISSNITCYRLKTIDSEYASVSPTIIINDEFERNKLLGFLNSNTSQYLMKFINPTVMVNVGDALKLPKFHYGKQLISDSVKDNIFIAKSNWDSHETSWDFEQSPLLNKTDSLEQAYQAWQVKVTQDFFQLHANEEELNRIFIDIYGLQDELMPEVPLKDITILQEELDRKELERLEPVFREKGKDAITLPIDKREVISQFISYSIGLFMGRYRLDKPGLNIAHPNPTKEELASYTYNGGQFVIDENAIVPLMGSQSNFKDDAFHRFNALLDVIWGEETHTENINFIQKCLNKDLEQFLVKEFYKYHCSMYKKKPIYWLFSSKKGAFQVLVYMHRMNEFTAEKIRANYLLEHIKNLRSEEAMLSANESNLSTQEARKLEQIRKDIHECEEYDMELKNIADQQIKFDLDDGVDANYKLFETVLAKIK